MEQLHAEVGFSQLCKTGEELCGDTVEVVRTPSDTIVVLSDGLGSGVKANILATLTTKIAASMLQKGIPLEDVVDTITATLPVCKQRKVAYSTFHILKISRDGTTSIVEFDCPATFLKRGNHVVSFPTKEKVISGKVIRVGELALQKDDLLIAVSDGVIHAGIGALLKLGWGWQGVASQLTADCSAAMDASTVSNQIISCCQGYYLDKAGDDSTVVSIKIRTPRQLTLFTGPPADKTYDEKVVQRFLRQPGSKIIAGGTTANIVSRVTNRKLSVNMMYHHPDVPPTGMIDGIDLVTEGVLTLNIAVERLRSAPLLNHLDGATSLARMLLEADEVNIIAGSAINPAHQNPNFPMQINLKNHILHQLIDVLQAKGKQVAIEWV